MGHILVWDQTRSGVMDENRNISNIYMYMYMYMAIVFALVSLETVKVSLLWNQPMVSCSSILGKTGKANLELEGGFGWSTCTLTSKFMNYIMISHSPDEHRSELMHAMSVAVISLVSNITS